ncbi:hypothetical protein IV203_035542 [Nitzschia inconspicua]|nr:hypothetical protein IV203_035542 [Nitzschia inconspicua]
MPDGTMKPTKPLLLYKHSAQHRYNKQKPGLNMNTELSDKVAFNSKGSFESKYVFRMMDAILVNAWRAHQAVFDIAPWLATLAEPPSLAQPSKCSLHPAVPEVQGKQRVADATWSAGEVRQGSVPTATANFELSWDAQFQDEEEQPDEDELVEEDQQDEEEGDKMDEDDIEAEETEEQYYDDVYFPEDIDSLEDSSEEEEEEEEEDSE